MGIKVKPVALITGGTSGIGLALAKKFASENYDLVIVARNVGELEKVKIELESKFKVSTTTIAKDLTIETAAKELKQEIIARNIEVDTLINNAGFAMYGEFRNVPIEKHLAVAKLNMFTLTALIGEFLPEMFKRGQGKILNVASTAAFQPGPFMAEYYATKAYVLSLSEALHSELKNQNIFVTCLCPGATKTAFQDTSEINKTRLIKSTKLMSAESVAEAGFLGLMKNKSVVIPGFKNKLLAFGTRLLPRSTVTAISRWFLEF